MESSSAPTLPEGSAESAVLSPNSKIAKMLADIDKQFDDDNSDTAFDTSASKPSQPGIAVQTSSSSLASPGFSGPFQQDSDSEESDDGVLRPHGRTAKRMNERHSTPPSKPRPGLVASDNPSRNFSDESEDDLYSSTPLRKCQSARVHTLSPTGSEQSNGLFVSPAKSGVDRDSEDDLPANPLGSSDRLKELVAQKRAERLAREAEQKKRKQSAPSSPSGLPEADFEDPEDAPLDSEIERIMSDASRPTRKASKKAIQEMERETQRLARQQALAHQMKTKKKFTTSDFLARFNFGGQKILIKNPVEEAEVSAADVSGSSAPNSDAVEEPVLHPVSTPPSSPPTPLDRQKALVDRGALSKLVLVPQDSIASIADQQSDDELPDMVDILHASQARKINQAVPPPAQQSETVVRTLTFTDDKEPLPLHDDDSDDGLEIVERLPAHLRVFERARGAIKSGQPADSKALHNLKHLSKMGSYDAPARKKKGARPSLNPIVVQAQLRKRAKEQARQQQLARIAELKAKGIEIQSAEDCERDAEAVENLLEKARLQAVELRKAEKAAAREGDETAMPASDDEEEDGDYHGSDLDEGDANDDSASELEDNELVDDAADESEDDEAEQSEAETAETAEEEAAGASIDAGDAVAGQETTAGGADEEVVPQARILRRARIVDDDEDEDDDDNDDHAADAAATPPKVIDTTAASNPEDDEDPFAAFNFGAGARAGALLSPTQAFNATMQTPTQLTQEDSMDILRQVAPPSFSSLPPSIPSFGGVSLDESEGSVIAGSQVPESQRINLQWDSQAPETPSLRRDQSALSETPGWEPTQDDGLPSPWTAEPAVRRESIDEPVLEHHTQSTVQLRVSESPVPSLNPVKRGRLMRRRNVSPDESSEDEDAAALKPEQKNAFREMQRKRRQALTEAERQESDKQMRQMMDEQAEESDDEYAGLGGDDYVAPETEQDREMIDSSFVDVDERALAAHYAERERAREEEETSRLYKDLTTGVLRRKMGANAFDLDEDEDDLALRRRQMRQREEARKRRALLKDENIATLAEGKQSKGKDAFLKAIADDDGGDDDVINLSDVDDDGSAAPSPDASQLTQSQNGPLTETSGNKRRLPDEPDLARHRAPAKQRRTEASAFRRPTSLLEVQESLSFLLDEPHADTVYDASELDIEADAASDHNDDGDVPDPSNSDDDAIAEEETRQNDGGFAPDRPQTSMAPPAPRRLPATQRRTPAAAATAVVDRLSLKRLGSASSADSAHSRTAWAAGPTTGGFKVPSLLRRATTSAAAAGANDRGVTTSNGAGTAARDVPGAARVKVGGSSKSSLAYQARSEERRSIVEASTRRKEENTRRIAALRRTASAGGLMGRGFGSFE